MTTPVSKREPVAQAPPAVDGPLLGRLNRRGFRLVQAADAVVLVAIMLGTMLVREGWATWPDYPKPLYFLSFGVTLLVFMAALYFGGLYERDPRLGSPPTLPRAAQLTLAAAGLVALLNLAATGAARELLGYATARALPMPILNLIVLTVLGAVGVAANRWASKRLRTHNEGAPRVLLVGAPDEVRLARRHIRDTGEQVAVVGEAASPRGLVDAVDDDRVTDVVLMSSRWFDDLYPDVLWELERRNVSVLQRVSAKETMFGLERVHQVGGMPFVLLRAQTLPNSRARFKRFTDLVLLVLLAPVFVPLLGAVTLYQLVVAGRPLLYWQTRVGVGGRSFRMVKFRTMIEEAEQDRGVQLAEHADPRIIPACGWVRATRFDELPQLYNVARGEMSLVGPRPERPELTAEFERLIPGYSRRHELPPGLTGLAQIHGRYHTDPEYKLGYDLQYLVNWSPVFDLQILARTVWVVLARRL